MNMTPEQKIADNLANVRGNIAKAEIEAGVEPGSVTLVGVTKLRTVERIRVAIDAGLTDIGENRVQESLEKLPVLEREVRRHFVGHLQRNKVRDVLPLFELIHSVDSPRLAREIDTRSEAAGVRAKILMQVNTSEEESKFGVEPQQADALLEEIAGCGNIDLLGLMTIGPLGGTRRETAACFVRLRRMFENYRKNSPDNCRMEVLSMGMSADYELAVSEGANLVRVGRAIFEPRKY
jgi:PLP dependent protein